MITICPFGADGKTFDGVLVEDALARLEAEGADVVGLNCGRGPRTMIQSIKKCREKVKVSTFDSEQTTPSTLINSASMVKRGKLIIIILIIMLHL